MSDQSVQSRVREIYKNPDLSSEEKSKKVFELLNQGSTKSTQSSKDPTQDQSPKPEEIVCSHYERLCQIKCPNLSCGKWYPCRICHDEHIFDHKLDRFAVSEIKCNKCDAIQEPSNECVECYVEFSLYYCDICHLWANKESNEIFHCVDCGICRLGDKEKVIHCQGCNMCIIEENHECKKQNNKDIDCMICMESVFDTPQKAHYPLKCGHSLHYECLVEYLKRDYRCPICKVSLCDMSDYWTSIDQALSVEQLPPPYDSWTNHIQCVDCKATSSSNFHPQYNKCQECGSYNTQVTGSDRPNLESINNNTSDQTIDQTLDQVLEQEDSSDSSGSLDEEELRMIEEEIELANTQALEEVEEELAQEYEEFERELADYLERSES